MTDTPTTNAGDQIGQVIDGRYVILEKIAHGGMATVYEAIDRVMDRKVALKLMHPHLANGPEGVTFVSRFRREARAAAKLHHPGIVTVFDQGMDSSISYLTMEYVEGTNLRRRLKDVGTFSVGDALKNIEHILRALAAAHRAGLVHRDVKPENVLINKRGQLQLTDFGLARVATEMSTSTTGTVFGTVAYLAPEIIETGQSDARSDVYSIGVMLYELIVGEQPYEGTTPIQIAFKHVNEDIPMLSDLHPEISRSVGLLIEVFSARDKNKRPPDAARALELLQKLAHSLSSSDLAAKLPRLVKPDVTESMELKNAQLIEPAVAFQSELDSENIQIPATLDSSDIYQSLPENSIEVEPLAHSSSNATQVFNEPIDEQVSNNLANPLRNITSNSTINESAENSISGELPTNILSHSQILNIQSSSHGLNSNISGAMEFESTELKDDTSNQVAKQNQRRIRIILLTVTVVLVAILAGVTVWWYQFYGPGSMMPVPYGIIGSTEADVVKKLQSNELGYIMEETFSDTVEDGRIIDSDPKSGELVSKYGKGVKLIVSKGIQTFDMPDTITGEKLTDALEKLKTAGFTEPKVNREYNKHVAKDVVISVDPEGGTKAVNHNQPITLLVSDGPKPVSLPNVQGVSIDDAIIALSGFGLQYTKTDVYSDEVETGVVISQATTPGTTVYDGDTIALTVSKGSETVAVPDVKGKSVQDAKVALEAADLKVLTQGEAELGLVQKQDVAPGTKVKRGTTITLTIV